MRIIKLLIISMVLFTSCNEETNNDSKALLSNKSKKVFNSIDYEKEKLELVTLKDSLIILGSDPKAKMYSQNLLSKTIVFANNYPGDKDLPGYLFVAARAANGLGEYTKSIGLLNQIITNYNHYDKISEVYFLRAFTYDEDLGNKPKAKNAYLEVIKKFPNDPLAEQAQQLLENLYLSDEELIKKYSSPKSE